ncbi:hypothetical protein B7494_g1768 [Chlorociboria aeruginascens]|nr:hypothetical protein B7494_g1768 [Chlorociboria aeruginascens]
MFTKWISVLAAAATTRAAIISIDVGKDASLSFEPSSATAAVGDTLEFRFYSGSGGHSVVSGAFDSPCQPNGNFFSGYIRGSDNGDMTFVTTVTSTDPIFFYCSLGDHCASGMAGVVNPASDQTLDDYISAAGQVMKASAPTSIAGGIFTVITAGSETSVSSTLNMAMSVPITSTSTTGSSAMPASTSKPSSASSVASSATSSAASAATTTTSSSAGQNDMWTVGGLTIILGGFVALMA